MVKRIAVVGAGTMGNGIAQTFATYDADVMLIDIKQEFLDRAMGAMDKSLSRFVRKEKISEAQKGKILGRIQTATSLDAVTGAKLVIEAVPESVELKKEVFGRLDQVADSDCILASNTSSISVTVLAAVTKRPEVVIGLHFMNPVPLMKLVEVIRGQDTSDETTDAVVASVKAIDKVAVSAGDYPGFVSNRVLMPMINEAIYCLMEGVATREGIDEIMKLGMNHPMGPLELADYIGLDVCLEIMDVLHKGFGDSKYRACPLLRRKVAAGHLGRKTGQGFYSG